MKKAKSRPDDMLRGRFVWLPELLNLQLGAAAASEAITVDQYITRVLAKDLGITDEELDRGSKERRRVK